MIYDHNTNQLLVLRKQDKIKDQILYVCSSYLLFRYPRHTKTSNIIDGIGKEKGTLSFALNKVTDGEAVVFRSWEE